MEKGTVSGRVTNQRGEPVAGAAAVISGASPAHHDIAALTNAQGHFDYVDLLPGLYTILINAEGYAPLSREVRVNAGQVQHETFELVA